MRRVVYCPSENDMDSATDIAKKYNLPIKKNIEKKDSIWIGDFDKPSVVEIPEFKNINFQKNVKNRFHQNIVYQNDYLKLNKNYILHINQKIYYPILVEKHQIFFNIYETIIGIKECSIVYENTVIESFEYNVY